MKMQHSSQIVMTNKTSAREICKESCIKYQCAEFNKHNKNLNRIRQIFVNVIVVSKISTRIDSQRLCASTAD
jgi:hypothetical protein